MRLFAAVWPPPAAVRELDEAVRPLRQRPGAEGLRWTRPAAWHFTLSFYGEADEDQARDLAVRLGRAAARAPDRSPSGWPAPAASVTAPCGRASTHRTPVSGP